MFETVINGMKYKVQFQHIGTPAPTGTMCIVKNLADEVLAFGESHAHPKDQFCRNTGRKLSLARALKQLGIPAEERACFWQSYYNLIGHW